MTPTLFETRDLIRLVKDRKCLWDRLDPDYRDRTLKDAAWLEIYNVIEPDYAHFSEDMKNFIGSQITKKWYNVRDSFVKSRKHGNRNKPYIYSKVLNFLEPVYFEEKELRSLGTENGEPWLNEDFVAEEDHNEVKRHKLEFEDKTDNEENVVSVLTALLQKEEDDDRAFFKSIIPAVKKLSEDSRIEFRIQVMNLLQAMRNRDKNGQEHFMKLEIVNEREENIPNE